VAVAREEWIANPTPANFRVATRGNASQFLGYPSRALILGGPQPVSPVRRHRSEFNERLPALGVGTAVEQVSKGEGCGADVDTPLVLLKADEGVAGPCLNDQAIAESCPSIARPWTASTSGVSRKACRQLAATSIAPVACAQTRWGPGTPGRPRVQPRTEWAWPMDAARAGRQAPGTRHR
jgi:hypothetical protein